MIRYPIGLKSGITYVDSHDYTKIKIDSDDDLPLKEIVNFHNVVIFIRSVFNENHNWYYY